MANLLELSSVRVFCIGLLLTAAACEVTSDKIQLWKTTQKGPGKLMAAVGDTGLELKLRSEAAIALVDIDRAQPLAADLHKLPSADRNRIADAVADRLLVRVSGASDQPAGQRAGLRAKDALFALRASLGDDERAVVDDALVRWLLEDWKGRSGGEHSGPKVIRAIGRPAAALLLERVAADPQVVVIIAGLLKEVGTGAERDKAAERLFERSGGQQGATEATLEALGRLGSASARVLLIGLAEKRSTPEEVRVAALLALAHDPHASSVDRLAALAGSVGAPKAVRGAAFEALEVIQSDATAAKIGRIVARDRDETVRYRAAEAVVSCCGAQGVAVLLQSLPTRYGYARADVEDLLEKDIKELGSRAAPALRQALASSSWIARVIAVRLLAELGDRQDIQSIEKLAEDRAKLNGWGSDATVGSEAQIALKRLRGRVK